MDAVTKAHETVQMIDALVDAKGMPIKLMLTAGQMSDITSAADLITELPEGAMLLADKATIQTSCEVRSPSAKHGPKSRPRLIARNRSASARSSVRRVTSSSASSSMPSASSGSRPATTSWPRTSSPPSNSSRFESGYASMRLRPRIRPSICFLCAVTGRAA